LPRFTYWEQILVAGRRRKMNNEKKYNVVMLALTDHDSLSEIIHENIELKTAEKFARELRIEQGELAIITIEPAR